VLRVYLCILITIIALEVHSEQNVKPLSWNGFVTVEDIYNARGGIKRGSVQDAAVQVRGVYDTEIAKLWSGGQFTFGFFGFSQSHNQSLYTGAIQEPSNLSADNNKIIRPYLSYQQKFNNITTARAGIIDLNDYFNVTDTASKLLNDSFAISPTLIENSPIATDPYPGYGTIVEIQGEHLGGQLGLFQGNPQHLDTVFHNGSMLIGEINAHFTPSSQKNTPEFILKVGGWRYHQSNAEIGNTNNGVYITTESIWQNCDDQKRGIFLQLSANPQNINAVPYSLGGGYTANAIFASRPKDVFSLGFSRIWINGSPRETIFEINYAIQIIDNLSLTPDLQYVVKPSGVYRNAFVGIIRLSYVFG